MEGRVEGAVGTRYRAVPAEQPLLFPTVQGMVYVAKNEEVWSSESANAITIRSTLSSTFPVKRRVEIDLGGVEGGSCAIALCCVPPFGMMWCALSCGRLVLVDLAAYIPKVLHVGEVVQKRRATPVHSMIFCGWHTSGSVVSTSVYGVITVWDAMNLVPLTFIPAAGSDLAASGKMLTPSKCMACWDAERFVFVGMRNMLVVADGALDSCTKKIPLGDGDALSMAFCGPERTLWVGKSDGSLVKVVFSEQSPEHLSPERRGYSSAVQKLASSLQEDAESLLDHVSVHVCSGIHRSYVHKVACASHHVVSCGGDGSTCVVDPVTGYVIQRVSLDGGLCVRELVVVGVEIVLFSLTDRSLRSMTLRNHNQQHLQRQADESFSPRRGASLHVTPRRAGIVARAGSPAMATRQVALPPDNTTSGVISTRHLIQHCVSLLQALQNLQTREAELRLAIDREEKVCRSNIDDVMEYRLLTKYVARGAGHAALGQLELDCRLYLSGELLALRLDLMVDNYRTLHEGLFAEMVHRLSSTWMHSIAELESSGRNRLESAESESRGWLRWGGTTVRVHLEDLSLCHFESLAADKVIHQLEQSVKNSTPTTTVDALRASLEAAVARAEHARESSAQRAAELEMSLAGVTATLASKEENLRNMSRQRCQDSMAVLASVESEQRALLEARAAEGWNTLLAGSHAAAMSLWRSFSAKQQDDARVKFALEDEVHSLQLSLQNTQRDQRTIRSTLDANVVMKKKLEADLADLRAQLEASDERTKKYEGELSALDLEVMRLRTHKSKLEERLDGATNLAEESCSTASQQQQLLRQARHGLMDAKECTVKLFTLFEASATTQFDSSLTNARGLLRDALYDIADARRCQATSIRNATQGPVLDDLAGGGARAGDEAGYLQGAFEKLKKVQDDCFVQLQDHCVIVDRKDCFSALRALLKSLEVVNTL